MDITVGLFEHMVLQRDTQQVARVSVRGVTTAVGTVHATIRQRGRVFDEVRDRVVGRSRGGEFTAQLPALPVGGPYVVELKVIDPDGRKRDSCTVRDVLVGDVWIAAGQSNMQGCGHLNQPLKPLPAVRAFFMDDRWAVAADPIHNMWEAVDPVHALLNGGSNPPKPAPNWGTCPAVAYAQALYAASGIPQGILACGHGGTTMTQWDPAAAAEQGNRCLYGALRRRLQKNGGRAAGMIWYQGCSDAFAEVAPLYTERMRALVAALRRDCHDAHLPVVAVQIARVTAWGGADAERAWNSIQEQQRRLPERIRHLAVVPAIDLPLDDGIHISEAGQARLGRRLAYAMRVLTVGPQAGLPIGSKKHPTSNVQHPTLKGKAVATRSVVPGVCPSTFDVGRSAFDVQCVPAGLPPLAVKGAKVVTDSFGRGMIEVSFEHVAGSLQSGGCRPTGFSLECAPVGALYDVVLDGSRALLRTGVPSSQVIGWRVWYGRGVDPYCNITDAADRSLPVCGPLLVGEPRAMLPALERALVSDLLPGAGTLAALELPKDLRSVNLKPRVFAGGFLNMQPEIGACGGEDRLVYFVIRYRCPEAMKLVISLGYDGPIKAWQDRRLLAADPAGVNPCYLDKRRARVSAAAGTHELVVALGTNGGRAWGIMVQFERLDVPRAILKRRDPSLYRVPEFEG